MTEKDVNNNLYIYSEDGEVSSAEETEFVPQDLENAPEGTWSIQSIWNEIAENEKREPKKRDYISFGDIGKTDLWSRYQKMNGIPETNPFDPRVLRIFQAGNEFHDLVKTVFKKVGIYINSQDDVDENGQMQWSEIPATDTTLKQFGAYDILVGGKPDLHRALVWIESSDLSYYAKKKAEKIARYFAEKFPNGLKPILYEVKSINSQAFWAKKGYLLEAYPHHKYQTYGYLKANYDNPITNDLISKAGLDGHKVEEARLLYVSKDDLTLAEFPIRLDNLAIREGYEKDIKEMSHYILNNIEPPKPPYVKFNSKKAYSFQDKKIKYKVKGSYEVNWEVDRSSYKNLMIQDDDKWEERAKEQISTQNKAIKAEVLKKVGS